MFLTLAILGGIVAVFFIVLAVLTARFFLTRSPDAEGKRRLRLRNREEGRRRLLRWTVADYLLLFPAAFAFLFLLVDVIAVLRDRSLFPDYHVGYLLCGFAMFLLSFLFLYARLLLTLGLERNAAAADQEADPTDAEGAEQRV
ncbi:hypothetical protein [Gorillibacterium sp. sgz500922]|uniref:hypothetical protein n=1 Tax=Gorillibacterium sp. sgz500922 TaxID=3446694 RepID=UPI003F66A39C